MNRLCTIVFLTLLYSCSPNHDPVNKFFLDAEERLTEDERIKLKGCTEVRCVEEFILNSDKSDFLNFLNYPPKIILDSLNYHGFQKNIAMPLVLAYCRYDKNSTFAFSEITKDIRNYFAASESSMYKFAEERWRQLESLAKKNFQTFFIGDTICLSFPIQLEDSCYHIQKFNNDRSIGILNIKSLILNKRIMSPESEHVKSHYFLKFKVIGCSRSPSCFLNTRLRNGKVIEMDVTEYGRDFTKICL